MSFRPGKIHARRAAFTFVEVLACLLFLGLLIPAVVGAITISNRAQVVAERTAIAAQLAENQLNELIFVEGSTNAGSGDFGADWTGYRWELKRGDWQVDSMTELTLSVFFQVQGHEHEVQLTTLDLPES